MKKVTIIFIVLACYSFCYGNNIKFIENKGQWSDHVAFRADVPAGKLFLEDKSLVYVFYDAEALEHGHHHETSKNPAAKFSISEPLLQMHAYKLSFINSQTQQTTGKSASFEDYNFFLGNDPSKWASGAKGYNEVVYQNLYQNIDMKLYSTAANPFKYDFIVAAGASPSQIKINIEGADKVYLENGHLTIRTSVNKVIEQKPFAYQLNGNDTVEVLCNYVLSKNIVSFSFPQGYDQTKQLIIDPLLIFSTYSGSFADNWGNTATFDDKGNLYSGGTVFDVGFPTTLGAYQVLFGGYRDIGILKYDSLGTTLLYSTHVGGSEAETPQSLVVNNQGELLIFGTTSSINYPVSGTAFSQAFNGGSNLNIFGLGGGISYINGSDLIITKLSESGDELLASTYIGGSGNDGILLQGEPLTKNYGDQLRGDIIMDEDDNVYVVSNTTSSDFPVLNGLESGFGGGLHDGVVFKINPDLSQLIWSSFIGGTEVDAAFSVKLDADNNVYIGGGTTSANFPVTKNSLQPVYSGNIDGFVTCIDKDGTQIISSTFIGTSNYDQVYFIDFDPDGDIFILGQTQGVFPVVGDVYSEANSGQFIQKLSSDLSTLLLSTTFGSGSSSPDISLTAFLVNDCGNIFLSGWGGAVNASYMGGNTFGLEVTADASQKTTDGSDFYLMVLSQDIKELVYATFFGGNNPLRGEHVDGGTSRFDKRGIVYHAVCAGCGANQTFPTTPGVWSRKNNSNNCNNAAFKFDLATLSAGLEVDINQGCAPLSINLQNKSTGGKYFTWNMGDGTIVSGPSNIAHSYNDPGVYQIVLKVEDESTCQTVDYAYETITVFPSNFNISNPDTICYGSQITLHAGGGVQYQWSPADGLSDTAVPNPIAKPLEDTQYFVHIIDVNGCEKDETVTISVKPELTAEFEFLKKHDCKEFPFLIIKNNSIGANDYLWDFGDGSTSSEKEPNYQYHDAGQYNIRLTSSALGCSSTSVLPITVQKLIVPNVFTPNGDDDNPSFQITTDLQMKIKVMNRWGKEVYSSEDYRNDWAAENINTGVYFYEVTFSNNDVCKGWVHVLK